MHTHLPHATRPKATGGAHVSRGKAVRAQREYLHRGLLSHLLRVWKAGKTLHLALGAEQLALST